MNCQLSTVNCQLISHRTFHRAVFSLAGAYNIVWGTLTAIYPQWFFSFAHMPPSNYPEIFVCMAIILAAYGLLYWYVAYAPELGWPIAAVGLLGKILGPIGMAYLILTRRWPMRAIVLCLTNDLIWWIPFALYLRDYLVLNRRARESDSAFPPPA